jgi:hypothetical protein
MDDSLFIIGNVDDYEAMEHALLWRADWYVRPTRSTIYENGKWSVNVRRVAANSYWDFVQMNLMDDLFANPKESPYDMLGRARKVDDSDMARKVAYMLNEGVLYSLAVRWGAGLDDIYHFSIRVDNETDNERIKNVIDRSGLGGNMSHLPYNIHEERSTYLDFHGVTDIGRKIANVMKNFKEDGMRAQLTNGPWQEEYKIVMKMDDFEIGNSDSYLGKGL